MKSFKWKIFIITSIVCLLPIIWGASVWNSLPDKIAIHFNMYGEPDNFADKGFAVFGLPIIMTIMQFFCCFASDMKACENKIENKFSVIAKWIIPCVTVVLYVLTLGYALGWSIDIRKAVAFLVGCLFLVMGNYIPKFDRVKNMNMKPEAARKLNRLMGYGMVVLGILFIISMFLPPIATVICVALVMAYGLTTFACGIVMGKK